ncbi:hypothetical protein H0H93_007960 [Arthromyces matolae]|nr:hypothetical protein H0H93_007960 [Arthromyces matolae]
MWLSPLAIEVDEQAYQCSARSNTGPSMGRKQSLPSSPLFGDKWCDDPHEKQLLKLYAPIYMRAIRENELPFFLHAFRAIWLDRFQNHYQVRSEWEITIQRQMVWAGPILGIDFTSAIYDNWRERLTVNYDRKTRRLYFIWSARNGVELEHPQYDAVVTELERTILRMTEDERFNALLDDIEDAYFRGGNQELTDVAHALQKISFNG